MRNSILYFLLLWGVQASAVVNMDEPILHSHKDFIFRSKEDPKQAYVFPIALVRLNAPTTRKVGNRIVSTFEMGVNNNDATNIENRLVAGGFEGVKVRYLHATKAEVRQNSGLDIPAEFDPQILPLAEAGDLHGPVTYALSLKSIHGFFRNKTEKLLSDIFANRHGDHIGILQYEFSAYRAGQLYVGQSSVSLFAGVNASDKLTNFSLTKDAPLAAMTEIILDSEVACWDQALPGQICLRMSP